MNAEIFILNYNGRELLGECLPSILAAAGHTDPPCSVTVIDNQSTDDSLIFLRKYFPQVSIYVSQKNRVLCTFNEVVEQSQADIVFLLNNDLKVEKDFIQPLTNVFKKYADAFLAAPKAYTFDLKQYEGSLSKMTFQKGILRAESRFPGHEQKVDVAGFTMQAGFGAYRREFFLKLGGFDSLYLPGTVEDSDICFRAWKSGYACYYAPQSRVYHKGQATFKKHFSRSRILAVNQRNLYLFVWKNITDIGFLAEHLVYLLPRNIYFLLKGRGEFLWGFLAALGRLPTVLSRRFSGPASFVRSDREIFAISERI